MSNRVSTGETGNRGRPRVLYFGMRCTFSVPPLQALLQSDIDLAAVVIPGAPGSVIQHPVPAAAPRLVHLPMAGSLPSIEAFAQEADVPLFSVGSVRDPDVTALIESLKPDVIAVACFPWLIPACIRSIPVYGCLNLHPSLLPRWRGPEPLFWTFAAGDTEAGVTVHLMDDGFDTGPILRQQAVAIADGVDGASLERELARLSGRLLIETIADHVIGATKPQIQKSDFASYAPMPKEGDFVFSTTLSARRLFNIIRGVTPLWGELRLRLAATGDEFTVKQALDFDPSGKLDAPCTRNGELLVVQCNPGIITVAVRP